MTSSEFVKMYGKPTKANNGRKAARSTAKSEVPTVKQLKAAIEKGAKHKKAVLHRMAQKRTDYAVSVAIDPGTKTGIAMREGKEWKSIQTVSIIEAIEIVRNVYRAYTGDMLLKIEDARLRTYFGNTGPEKWKGAGSIMRDCRIWEAEMERQGIPVEWVHPKDVKETTAAEFKQLTGWGAKTSIHAREAAFMIL